MDRSDQIETQLRMQEQQGDVPTFFCPYEYAGRQYDRRCCVEGWHLLDLNRLLPSAVVRLSCQVAIRR
jgi:hypothetical protein